MYRDEDLAYILPIAILCVCMLLLVWGTSYDMSVLRERVTALEQRK